MRTKKSSQPKNNRCPYFKDKECGNPDKMHSYRCNSTEYGSCISYVYLEECNKKEEVDDGATAED